MSEIFEQKQALIRARGNRALIPAKPVRPRTGSPFSWQGFSVIAEIKRASPSAGAIAAHPLPFWTQGLQAAGASMLSVLTEETYFKGSLATLESVAGLVEIPLLRKDFLCAVFELDEAQSHGASAVLLIAAGLPRAELLLLFTEARARGLGVLLEVHALEELDAAFACCDFSTAGVMLGINQRNLQSLVVDPRGAEKFPAQLPKDTRFIVESGIKDAVDCQWAKDLGARGVLVGEALARAPDPGARLQEWLGALQ